MSSLGIRQETLMNMFLDDILIPPIMIPSDIKYMLEMGLQPVLPDMWRNQSSHLPCKLMTGIFSFCSEEGLLVRQCP